MKSLYSDGKLTDEIRLGPAWDAYTIQHQFGDQTPRPLNIWCKIRDGRWCGFDWYCTELCVSSNIRLSRFYERAETAMKINAEVDGLGVYVVFSELSSMEFASER